MGSSPETDIEQSRHCDAEQGPPRAWQATLAPAGWSFGAPAGQPLLQSAEQAGLRLPSSCRNGTCRTCICRLAQGQTTYRIDWPGLSAEEKTAGWILPCVAYPLTDVLLLQPAAQRTGSPAPDTET